MEVAYANKTSDNIQSNCSATSQALVPYDHNIPFQQFKTPTRSFQFVGQQLTILQQWDLLGVAAVVWDSAIVLSEFLEVNPEFAKNKNVIELGAGTGLVGIVAALLGGDVTVTERQSALENLCANVNANTAVYGNISLRAKKLDWTNNLSDSFMADYDLIVGADIIYIEETFPHLLKTLLYFTNRSGSVILLSCKIRYSKDSKFLEQMKCHFETEELFYDTARDIHIFKATRLPLGNKTLV
ncbi:protein N-lysine methyltransferase METTL21A [Octopus sinensis]|uniref:Protein N-lysine methyltransferase METTL21A n=1 Tax=Octopus sinensis TaxID=2607531 RepID=A0A6P7U2S6_9MOLL|nr:protein N-lysine methyltransferase METTL21A [Octopus sinensis]